MITTSTMIRHHKHHRVHLHMENHQEVHRMVEARRREEARLMEEVMKVTTMVIKSSQSEQSQGTARVQVRLIITLSGKLI
jgi:hypothetical protein